MAIDESSKKLTKIFDQDVEITGTLEVGGNTVLTSFTETDPTVPSHVKSITTTNISNWDTAYGWGNHADAGYITSVPTPDLDLQDITDNGNTTNNAIYVSNLVRLTGTGTANSQLDLPVDYGAIRWYDGSTFKGGIGTSGWSALGTGNDLGFYLNSGDFHIGNGSSEFVTFNKANERVGIGTTSPRNKLQVEGNIEFGNWTTAGSRYVGYSRQDNGNFGVDGASGLEIESGNFGGAGNYDQKVHIWTHTYNGGSGRRLTVDNYGRVGIGQTSPSYTLDVNGNTRIDGNLPISGYVDLTGILHTRSNLNVLNAAGNGWTTWATRSGGNYNLNIGSLTVGGTTTTSDIYAQGSQVWSETTQGRTIGTIHIDPASGTDHAGGAITWGASDSANGTVAQAGIYVRSDGSYGTKMYFSTTDSYAVGSKTAMSIDQTGLVTINPRLDGAKSFRVYYDMDIYNTVNFTDASWNFKGSIRGNSSGDVIIRSGSAVETTFRSDGYLFAPTWIKIGSGSGIYSDTNSAHFYPNTYSNYGTWRIDGDRGNYSGILVNDVSAMPHIMYDNSGNGGLYNQGNGRWSVYYAVGNDCVAIGGSATVSGYKARVNGALFADGNIYTESSIFAEDDVRVNSNSSGSYYLRIYKAAGSDGGVLLYGGGALDWQIVNTDSRELDFYSYTKGADVFRIDGNGNIAMYNSQFREIASGCPAITLGGNNGSISGGLAFETNTTNRAYQYYESGYMKYQTQTSSIGHLFITAGTSNALLISGEGNTRTYGGISNDNSSTILIPEGARYTTSASSVAGAIKIALPTARYKSNTMMTFKVVIYEYGTGQTYEFRISGYNYSDTNATWYNVSAVEVTDGGPRHTVRFGQDGSRQCVWIGETSATWSYPQVHVTDFTGGYSGLSLDGWADGWSISFVSSFDNISQTRTPARLGYNINASTVRLDSGTDYPIDVTSNQRYQIGMRYLGIGESSYYPYLAHDYGSQVDQGNQSQFIIHFNGIGDKFRFNRSGYFEADGSVVTKNWFRTSGGGGLYFQSYSRGLRDSQASGSSYGNCTTYNSGHNGWDGWSLGRNDMSYMGQTNNMGLYAAGVGDWAFYYYQPNRGVGLMTSTTSSTYEVYVGGDLYATGDIVAYSDRRVKENIINIDSALDKVKALQGVYYNRINDKDKVREIGFIAQDVHDAVPELASYAGDVDEWGVKYSQVTGLHNEAIKELAQELDKKDEQIANLQAQIDELKKLILNK